MLKYLLNSFIVIFVAIILSALLVGTINLLIYLGTLNAAYAVAFALFLAWLTIAFLMWLHEHQLAQASKPNKRLRD